MTKVMSLRATKRSAAIQKCMDCIVALLIAMTVSSGAIAKTKIDICKIVEAHKPQSDVAYQPGIDAYGNAVVPADLNANAFQVPSVIKVPLNIDLAERMTSMVDGLDLEAPLGMIEIYQDGRVRYNDQDWGAPVATLCGHSHKVIVEEEAILKITAQEPATTIDNGLEGQDNIKSLPVVSKRVPEAMIEIAPTVAIPPQDVNIEQIEVDPAPDESPESDIIEGGEYREIYYNE